MRVVVLGGFVASLRDKPQTAWSIRVVQATQLAPSLWPVLFSAIVGNALHGFADWKVERGASLMV